MQLFILRALRLRKQLLDTDVIVVFQDRGFLIKEAMPKKASIDVLVPYKDVFWHPYILASTLVTFFNGLLDGAFRKSKTSLLAFMYDCHLFSALKLCGAPIIATHIHDSLLFHRLAHRHHGAKFFAIQNGMNNAYDLGPKNQFGDGVEHKLRLPHFFCFGEIVQTTYQSFGHDAEVFNPVGSIAASVYRSYRKAPLEKKFDLCFVSQWSVRFGLP